MRLRQSRAHRSRPAFALLASLSLCSLVVGGTFLAGGCGGGNGNRSGGSTTAATTGRAAITIHWPARPVAGARLIPELTNAIQIQVFRTVDGAQTLVTTRSVGRPASGSDSSSVIIDNLPVDTLTVTATAYPGDDSSSPASLGAALARGSVPVTTLAGQSVPCNLTMGSTIDHLSTAPTAPSLTAGQARELIVTAWDGPNESTAAVVLLSDTAIAWKSANIAVATVVKIPGRTSCSLTAVAPGTASITVTDDESTRSVSTMVTVAPAPTPSPSPSPSPTQTVIGPISLTPQFDPNDGAYAGSTTIIDTTGGWTASGDSYAFDSNAATLTDTTTGTLVATGKLVTQTFSAARTSVTYAVFDFPGAVTIGSGSQVTGTGANPVVLLTQSSFTLSGGAAINFSANSSGPGPGGGGPAQGPGAGGQSSSSQGGGGFPEPTPTPTCRGNNIEPCGFAVPAATGLVYYDGGGSFGGVGGSVNAGVVYGADFATATGSHLQGGSGSYGASSGGALYVGSVGALTISGGSITADGFSGGVQGGGSGGGIALFGAGAVAFSQATIDASGGDSNIIISGNTGGPGGGGRVVVGYPLGTASVPDVSFINVNGGVRMLGTNATLSAGYGAVTLANFAGF